MRMMLAGLALGLGLTLAGTASANPPAPTSCSGCNDGCGINWRPGHFVGRYWNFVKAPCPSDAPTRRNNAPLAFQSHPYARSPRDYFMQD